ncbi:hypothetical protein ACH4U6_36740 [Streptomyces netropsis]|uniref:hypothetical protein n=1 Tax=Streptomyces netropsis TaxID=55404 RepID=UPI003793B011
MIDYSVRVAGGSVCAARGRDTYQLRLGPALHDIYLALPDASRRNLAGCLVDMLSDPFAHSTPYGVDDGTVRSVAHGLVAALVLVGQETMTVTVVQISCAEGNGRTPDSSQPLL